MVENEEPKDASEGKWLIPIPGEAELEGYKGELVEWPKSLSLPAVPPLEYAAEKYFTGSSTKLDLLVGDISLTQFVAKKLAEDLRVRADQAPFLENELAKRLRPVIQEEFGLFNPPSIADIHRFWGDYGRPTTRAIISNHPEVVNLVLSHDPKSNVFKMLRHQLRNYPGVPGLPGGFTTNPTGHAEYSRYYPLEESKRWRDSIGVHQSTMAYLDWAAAIVRSRNDFWVDPKIRQFFLDLLVDFNEWLGDLDVH